MFVALGGTYMGGNGTHGMDLTSRLQASQSQNSELQVVCENIPTSWSL
jgi:hypothetical protein